MQFDSVQCAEKHEIQVNLNFLTSTQFTKVRIRSTVQLHLAQIIHRTAFAVARVECIGNIANNVVGGETALIGKAWTIHDVIVNTIVIAIQVAIVAIGITTTV